VGEHINGEKSSGSHSHRKVATPGLLGGVIEISIISDIHIRTGIGSKIYSSNHGYERRDKVVIPQGA
jgi:hypothetical protein